MACKTINLKESTINLKESIPASLLFCCYLCAEGKQSRPDVPPSSCLGGTGHCLRLLSSTHSFSCHHLTNVLMDQLISVLTSSDQAKQG